LPKWSFALPVVATCWKNGGMKKKPKSNEEDDEVWLLNGRMGGRGWMDLNDDDFSVPLVTSRSVPLTMMIAKRFVAIYQPTTITSTCFSHVCPALFTGVLVSTPAF
jgi:hypothetical protein